MFWKKQGISEGNDHEKEIQNQIKVPVYFVYDDSDSYDDQHYWNGHRSKQCRKSDKADIFGNHRTVRRYIMESGRRIRA